MNIKAFTVDEGINGYRSTGLEKAKKLSEELGIEHEIPTEIDMFLFFLAV